jgi:hypothetical protein
MNARVLVAGVVLAVASFTTGAFAHCDSLDGPVVKAGREALEKGNLDGALAWVKAGDEGEIRGAFDKARTVRGLGDAAREVADTYFLETLVRVHRSGEGESYTGLKPAGRIPAGIALADKSIASGDPEGLVKQVTQEVTEGIRTRFAAVMARKEHAGHSVEAGREFVAAYVAYIHYVESFLSGAHPQDGQTSAPAHAH